MLAPFDVTVCGIEELPEHCAVGVSHVLSILDPDAPVPPAFGAFGEHERLELRFHDIIIDVAERLRPEPEHVAELLQFGRGLIGGPGRRGHLLVHCHAGISRSNAAMTLILAQALPATPGSEIVAEVLRIRPKAWPNLRMIEIGDVMLGRRGDLVAAVPAAYRRQLQRRPELAEAMRGAGRGREVDAAVTAG